MAPIIHHILDFFIALDLSIIGIILYQNHPRQRMKNLGVTCSVLPYEKLLTFAFRYLINLKLLGKQYQISTSNIYESMDFEGDFLYFFTCVFLYLRLSLYFPVSKGSNHESIHSIGCKGLFDAFADFVFDLHLQTQDF
jgi:hypothetical protein